MNKDYCKHEYLNFGSGDYYIFCYDCSRSWVQKGDVGDIADSSNLTKAPMNSYDYWVPEDNIVTAVKAERKASKDREIALRTAIEKEIRILRMPLHDPFIEDKGKPYVPAPEWKLRIARRLQEVLSPLDNI